MVPLAVPFVFCYNDFILSLRGAFMKRFNKILAILLVFALLFGFAACSKKDTPADSDFTLVEGLTKEEYDGMTADQLLKKGVADRDSVTAEEYYWLISTYAYVDIVDDADDAYYMGLEDNITDEAIEMLDYEATPSISTYIAAVLQSPIPQVRAYGVSQINTLFGVSDSNLELAKQLIETENDNYVLYCAMKALSNELASDPDIAKFAFRMADADYFKLRVQAACAFGNSWSIGVDGVVEKIISMMNDDNQAVRSAACRYAGDLEDEAVIDPLVAILNDDSQYELHGDCIESLVALWFDYPFHECTSEKAYNATMDYLRKTPRSENIPYWTSVGSFRTIAEGEDFDSWQAKATYYNTDEIYDVMVDIIKDGNANWLGRSAAIDEIKAHCSAQQFAALKSVVDSLTDSDASLVQSAYESKVAE